MSGLQCREDIFGNGHNLDIGFLASGVRATVVEKTGQKPPKLHLCSPAEVVSQREYYILEEWKKLVPSLKFFPILSFFKFISMSPEKNQMDLGWPKIFQAQTDVSCSCWPWGIPFRVDYHSLRFMICGPWPGQSFVISIRKRYLADFRFIWDRKLYTFTVLV